MSLEMSLADMVRALLYRADLQIKESAANNMLSRLTNSLRLSKRL